MFSSLSPSPQIGPGALFFTPTFPVPDLKPGEWERMKEENDWNEVDLRDSRYNQVIHMVSSANGAEMFYHTAGHETRHENLQLARSLDAITSQVTIPQSIGA